MLSKPSKLFSQMKDLLKKLGDENKMHENKDENVDNLCDISEECKDTS